MEALEHLSDVFTTMTETTTATGSIPTAAESPRVQIDTPCPRVPTRSPKLQKSLKPVPELVVEDHRSPKTRLLNHQNKISDKEQRKGVP